MKKKANHVIGYPYKMKVKILFLNYYCNFYFINQQKYHYKNNYVNLQIIENRQSNGVTNIGLVLEQEEVTSMMYKRALNWLQLKLNEICFTYFFADL